MILDVILGVTIDTEKWVRNLKENESDFIIVVDYTFHKEKYFINDVLYCSPLVARKYIEHYHSVNFYKSLYVLPTIK